MSTRREFLTICGKVVGSAALGTALLPVLQSCVPSSAPITPISGKTEATVDVSDLSAANPTKVLMDLIGPDGKPVLVTRVSEGNFKALSMNCTHQGCTIESKPTNGVLPCLCHNSTFALDGAVLSPPATTPLRSYSATYDAGSQTLHVSVA